MNRPARSRRLPLSLSWSFVLAACAVGPDAPPPTFELPEAMAPAPAMLAHWWCEFGDDRLVALIERAFAANQDLRAAAANVDAAAAAARAADDLLPLIDARLGAGRSQTSDRSAFPRFPIVDRRNFTHSVGLDLTYEVDLWGRIRAGERAVLAELAADQQAMAAVRASLAAQVAATYCRVIVAEQRLQLLQRTVQNRQDALAVVTARRGGGTNTALQVHQAEAELADVAVLLPRAAEAVLAGERALLQLVGATPRELAAAAVARAAVLPTPPAVPAELPSDLLQRRPDVRAAEARLAASAARVSEARAHYFPTIRLTGSVGQESKALHDLFVSPSTVWNLAAGLTQPLFGLRKIDAAVDGAEARRLGAEATYAATVQAAFREVLDALGALAASRATAVAQQHRRTALAAAERAAAARHAAGAGNYLDLLDARRGLLAAEHARLDVELDLLLGTIDVCHTMGGGFDAAVAPRATAVQPRSGIQSGSANVVTSQVSSANGAPSTR
ncbi:MAG: TolC family protein [Planctomycetes bacterium]|nr:TolC family protein [Planctomycetota bacterium]